VRWDTTLPARGSDNGWWQKSFLASLIFVNLFIFKTFTLIMEIIYNINTWYRGLGKVYTILFSFNLNPCFCLFQFKFKLFKLREKVETEKII